MSIVRIIVSLLLTTLICFLVKRDTYRSNDSILREYSIARDYWINVINRLKNEEREANKEYTFDQTPWEQIVQLIHQEDKQICSNQ